MPGTFSALLRGQEGIEMKDLLEASPAGWEAGIIVVIPTFELLKIQAMSLELNPR